MRGLLAYWLRKINFIDGSNITRKMPPRKQCRENSIHYWLNSSINDSLKYIF